MIAESRQASKKKPSSESEEQSQIQFPQAKTFIELPLSQPTKEGLNSNDFLTLTEIQRATIPHTLAGRDLLGAAKTGSGKTLAFIIPVLEKLYRLRWGQEDGLGALIIAPNRELAIQIFEVLRNVGSEHDLSAGLIIGGKDLKKEQQHISRMNILVSTPGRLLQHIEQTPLFDTSNLQILVLDEADKILETGFSEAVNSIVESLPESRQTLLFSATQTTKIEQLARLALRDPEYISVHEKSKHTTPAGLTQYLMYLPLLDKIDTLFSFLRTHQTSKILVFVSSTKQVRFFYESFRYLNPGLLILSLYGKQKQERRSAMYYQFINTRHVVLFATDIASRGLDFPDVDWVVQVDCPEDVETYIHRVGRTARYKAEGQALLFLLESETAFEEHLNSKNVPVEVMRANPSKKVSVVLKLQELMAQDVEMKYLAQKACVSYLRSIYLQKDKNVFKIEEMQGKELAESMGLVTVPVVKFTKGTAEKTKKNQKLTNLQGEGGEEDSEEEEVKEKGRREKGKEEKMMKRKNAGVLSERYERLREGAEEEEDDLLVLKQRHNWDKDEEQQEEEEVKDNKGLKRKLLDTQEQGQENNNNNNNNNTMQDWEKKLKEEMKQVDEEDKKMEKAKRKQRKRQKLEKERQIQKDKLGGRTRVVQILAQDDQTAEGDEQQDQGDQEEDEGDQEEGEDAEDQDEYDQAELSNSEEEDSTPDPKKRKMNF